mgnify:CR=1 FL=1
MPPKKKRRQTEEGIASEDAPAAAQGESAEVKEALDAMWCDPHATPAVVLVGTRGSGKSFFSIKMIRGALENGAIDKLFAVVPTLKFEASGSYAWFNDPQYAGRIFVQEAYSPTLTLQLLNRKIEEKSSRICYWIDDLAAADGEVFWADKAFAKLLVVSRHLRTCVVLCNHSVASGHQLPAFVRQNISHLVLMRVSNRKLLETAYIEFLSLHKGFRNFKHFLEVFVRISEQGPGSGICIDLAGKAPGKAALSIREWWQDYAPETKAVAAEKKAGAPAKNVNVEESVK